MIDDAQSFLLLLLVSNYFERDGSPRVAALMTFLAFVIACYPFFLWLALGATAVSARVF